MKQITNISKLIRYDIKECFGSLKSQYFNVDLSIYHTVFSYHKYLSRYPINLFYGFDIYGKHSHKVFYTDIPLL